MALTTATEEARGATAAAPAADATAAPVCGTLQVEWRELCELEPITGQWRALAGRALDANVFYEPAFALAGAPVFGEDTGAVLVWTATSPRRLLGLFPARIERRRYGLAPPVLTGWVHPYAPLGTPLVDRDAAQAVIATWLDYVADNAALPGLVLLPLVPESGAFAAALGAALQSRGLPQAVFNRHCRALLAPGADRAHYLDRALGAGQRRELRRLGRRLGDNGAVAFTTAAAPADIGAALDDFFAIEAGGWKGKAHTAAACDTAIAKFMTTALGGLAAEHKAAITSLRLDGRAIATGIALRSADTAWFWKTAYDESFARFAPGVLLAAALTGDLAADQTIAQADSCAAPGHPIMERIWRERLALGDLLLAARPRAPFALTRRLEAIRCAAHAAAKGARSLLR